MFSYQRIRHPDRLPKPVQPPVIVCSCAAASCIKKEVRFGVKTRSGWSEPVASAVPQEPDHIFGIAANSHYVPAADKLWKALNSLLAEYLVGPCNKCHQIRRSDEASIFSINVSLGDRTGQRASRSYVEGDFVLYRFGNCLR